MEKNSILFTDPSSLGVNKYYSSTGDVDDLACIIYMSQKLKGNLSVVICDDDSGQRYSSFIDLIGEQLKTNYGIQTLKEVELTDILPDTDIYIHAPILDSTAQKLSKNIQNINNVCTQGDDTAVNFKNSQGAKNFISKFQEVKPENLHRYDTKETNFTLSYDPKFKQALTVPDVSEIYYNYFLFQQRKSFGTALGLGFLCDRLYSDTGFEGGPGNGIKKYKELIQTLKDEGKLLPLSGNLLKAFNNTIKHSKKTCLLQDSEEWKTIYFTECDLSAIQNGKDLISLMNLYCNYENLIVDDKLPNMGNLGNVQKREGVDERVSRLFDIVPGFTSTPLFDFASAYFSISGEITDKSTLIQAALQSLSELNEKLSLKGGKRTQNNKKSNKRPNKKTQKNKREKRKNKNTNKRN